MIPQLENEISENHHARAWSFAKQIPITKSTVKLANVNAEMASFKETLGVAYNHKIEQKYWGKINYRNAVKP